MLIPTCTYIIVYQYNNRNDPYIYVHTSSYHAADHCGTSGNLYKAKDLEDESGGPGRPQGQRLDITSIIIIIKESTTGIPEYNSLELCCVGFDPQSVVLHL